MPVPGYQEFMLPLLKIASDGQEHTVSEVMETLARQMEISETDRDILLPSGTQTRFYFTKANFLKRLVVGDSKSTSAVSTF